MDKPDGTISINENNDTGLDNSVGAPPSELISEPLEVESSLESDVKNRIVPALKSSLEPEVKTQQQTSNPVQNSANIEPDIHSQAPPPTQTINHAVDVRPSDRRLSPVQLIGQWMQSFIHRSTQYISVKVFKRQLIKFPALSDFLKMHTMTFLFILLFVMALTNVCVLYLPLVVVLTIAVAKPGQKRQRILLLLSTVYSVSIQLIKIVIIEMDKESKPNCTPQVESKISTPLTYIFGAYSAEDYIVSLLISTFLAGILIIAPSLRAVRKPSVGWDNNTTINNIILFPEANIKDAGKSFEQCFKFLMTWGFYKFGFEVFLIAMVISVHIRMDFVSLITMACAIVTVVCKRFCEQNKFHKWLIIFVRLESVLIILQYTAIVGLPPFACIDYPWKNILTNHTENTNMIVWFDWPDYQHGPNAAFLLLDFIVLLLAGRLFLVLRKESACGLSSGFAQKTSKSDIGQVCLTLMSLVVELGANTTRKKIEEIAGNNKPSDMAISFGINDEDQKLFGFVSERKRMFDYLKAVVFKHGFWFTFSIIFIAGVTNSSLFGVAYLSLAVIIAWRGNSLFLLEKSVPSESKWRTYQRKIENSIWLVLLFYSAAVMLIKVLLQFVGCVLVSSLTDACWLRQLLSIVCLDASSGSKVNQDWRYVTGKDSCDVRLTAATTFFDLLCFVCVLLQQRIVESSYFKHCILQFFIESQLQQ
uniref:Piezo domain-containing protein n=1 Tax=Plectus sambesii TaxID=2011161 RepID=A0A914W9E5_9BILA